MICATKLAKLSYRQVAKTSLFSLCKSLKPEKGRLHHIFRPGPINIFPLIFLRLIRDVSDWVHTLSALCQKIYIIHIFYFLFFMDTNWNPIDGFLLALIILLSSLFSFEFLNRLANKTKVTEIRAHCTIGRYIEDFVLISILLGNFSP